MGSTVHFLLCLFMCPPPHTHLMLGIKPRTLSMIDRCSIIELYCQYPHTLKYTISDGLIVLRSLLLFSYFISSFTQCIFFIIITPFFKLLWHLPHLYLPKFVSVFFFCLKKPIIICATHILLDGVNFHLNLVDEPAASPLKKMDSTRGETSCSPLLYMLEFCLYWACAVLTHISMTDMNSYV